MLRILSALIVFLLLSETVNSQEQSYKNRLGLSVGIGYIERQDRIFSPMIHKDLSVINAGISFTAEGSFYHNVILRFSSFSPSVTPSFSYFEDGELKSAAPHSFILVNVAYSGGKKWQAGLGEIGTGLLLLADVQALNYAYGRISSFGYFSAIAAGGFLTYFRPTGEKGRISAFLNLPVISLYSRSPYLVNDDEYIENISSHSGVKTFMAFIADGKVVTWNKLQYINTGIKYEHDLSGRWGIGASWEFDFIHAASPRKLLSFRNTFYLSSFFRF